MVKQIYICRRIFCVVLFYMRDRYDLPSVVSISFHYVLLLFCFVLIIKTHRRKKKLFSKDVIAASTTAVVEQILPDIPSIRERPEAVGKCFPSVAILEAWRGWCRRVPSRVRERNNYLVFFSPLFFRGQLASSTHETCNLLVYKRRILV